MRSGLAFLSASRLSASLLVASVLAVASCEQSGGGRRTSVDAAVPGQGGAGAHGGSQGSGGSGDLGGSRGSNATGGIPSTVATGGTSQADTTAATDDPSGKVSAGGSTVGGSGGNAAGGTRGMGGKDAAGTGASAGGSASGDDARSGGAARSDGGPDVLGADSSALSCYQEGLAAITPDLLRADITMLASADFEGRKTGSAGERKAVDYIVGQLKAAGLDGVDGKYEQPFSVSGVSGSNTVAMLAGSDPSLQDDVIVIGAHHDHLGKTTRAYYPGADDNASGASAVMALGRAFAKCKGQLKRTLVFMTYGGEEEGLYGSLYYTRYPLFPIANTMYMVNHDMIGYVAKNKLEVSWGTAFAKATLTAACNKVSFCKLIQSDMTNEQGTDSDTFAAVKVPYTGFFSGFHDCYHKTCDTADKLDMTGVSDTTKLSFDLVYALVSTGQGLVKSAARESGMVIDRSLRPFRDHGVVPLSRQPDVREPLH